LDFRSRDEDRDLGLQVSRPRPRPGSSGLETKTETWVFRSRNQDRDLGLQVSKPRPIPGSSGLKTKTETWVFRSRDQDRRSDGRKKKYIEMFGSFMEPFNSERSAALKEVCALLSVILFVSLDLGLQVSRPRTRPGSSGLKTKTDDRVMVTARWSHTRLCDVGFAAGGQVIPQNSRYVLTGAFVNDCWLGDRKDIRPVKNWVLICWW